MREHIELVYILQNRVEKGIVYFFWHIVFRVILLLTLGCLDNIYIYLIPVEIEFLYFTWESLWSWCIYSKTKSNKALYIFSNRLYSEPFLLNVVAPRYYVNFFWFAELLTFGILQERAYWVGVYTPKQCRKVHCIFFLTD